MFTTLCHVVLTQFEHNMSTVLIFVNAIKYSKLSMGLHFDAFTL